MKRARSLFIALSVAIASSSCAQTRFPDLRFTDSDGKGGPMTMVSGPRSFPEGKADLVADGDRFAFPDTAPLNGEASLVIEYLSEGSGGAKVELTAAPSGSAEKRETSTWDLALSTSPVSFFIPLKAGYAPKEIAFRLAQGKGELRLEGLRIDPNGAFRGFERAAGRISISPGCSISPSAGKGRRLALPIGDPGARFYSLSMAYSAQSGMKPRLRGAGLDMELLPGSSGKPLVIPAVISGNAVFSLEMPESFVLDSFVLRPSGGGPLSADPRTILDRKEGDFRRGGYELFRWDAFPEILILLFSDYGQQDLALKRLAFYAEKSGFRGRLAADEEIKDLHGWNAHDYPASTLAKFFAMADAKGFPLNQREVELRGLLEENGVIVKGKNAWTEGKGALLSVSLESSRAMRERFMAHEGFHGIYFIDGEFRKRVKAVWEGVDPEIRTYILEFFDFKELDVNDPELMANEFASYFLQTPLAETPGYFTGTVADFLEADRGGGGGYRKFAQAHRNEFFEIAKTLDEAVDELYVLNSGRVWRTQAR